MPNIFHGRRQRCIAELTEVFSPAAAPRPTSAREAAAEHVVDAYLYDADPSLQNQAKRESKIEGLLQQAKSDGPNILRIAEVSCAHALPRPRVEALISHHRDQAQKEISTQQTDSAIRELNLAKKILDHASFAAPDLDQALLAQLYDTYFAADQLVLAKLSAQQPTAPTSDALQARLDAVQRMKSRGVHHRSATLVPTAWRLVTDMARSAVAQQLQDADAAQVQHAGDILCSRLALNPDQLTGAGVATLVDESSRIVEVEADRAQLSAAQQAYQNGDAAASVTLFMQVMQRVQARGSQHPSYACLHEVKTCLHAAANAAVNARLQKALADFRQGSIDQASLAAASIASDMRANPQWEIAQNTVRSLTSLQTQLAQSAQSARDQRSIDDVRALLAAGRPDLALRSVDALLATFSLLPATHASRVFVAPAQRLLLDAAAALPGGRLHETLQPANLESLRKTLARLQEAIAAQPGHVRDFALTTALSVAHTGLRALIIDQNPDAAHAKALQLMQTGSFAAAEKELIFLEEVLTKISGPSARANYLPTVQTTRRAAQLAPKIAATYKVFTQAQAAGEFQNVLLNGRKLRHALKSIPASTPIGLDAGVRRGLVVWDIENCRLETFASMFAGIDAQDDGAPRQRAALIALGYLEGPAASFTFTCKDVVKSPKDLTKHNHVNMKSLIAAAVPKSATKNQATIKIAHARLQFHSDLQQNGIASLVMTADEAFTTSFAGTAGNSVRRKKFYAALEWACVEAQIAALGDALLDPLKENMEGKTTDNQKSDEYMRVFSLLQLRKFKKEKRYNLDEDDAHIEAKPLYQDSYLTAGEFRKYLREKNFLQDQPAALDAVIKYQLDVVGTLNP